MTKEQIEALKMRLNAQAMEIVRLRQENDDIRGEVHQDENIASALCPGCGRHGIATRDHLLLDTKSYFSHTKRINPHSYPIRWSIPG